MEEKKTVNINAKNVNAGTNYGHIGDINHGIKQRVFTDDDLRLLIAEINKVKTQFQDVNNAHLELCTPPGDAEAGRYAGQVYEKLTSAGYRVINGGHIMGGPPVDIQVTLAPDRSIMINVMPASNI